MCFEQTKKSVIFEVVELQKQIFSWLKQHLPHHTSFVDEIAETLGISTDSAYRRIRAEKELSLSELETLIQHYQIPISQLLSHQHEKTLVFQYQYLSPERYSFEDYFKDIIHHLKQLSKIPQAEIAYSARDLPIFHYFHFPEIMAFKLFVWQKTILGFTSFEKQIFSFDTPQNTNLFELGNQILELYLQIPSTELWNIETLMGTLRQIHFYHEANLFATLEDVRLLCQKLIELVNHLETCAAEGVKYAHQNTQKRANMQLYLNEVILSDNLVMAISPQQKMTFLTHNALNFLSTKDSVLCENTYQWFQNAKKRSILVSATAEKQRNKFFGNIIQKIKQLENSL